jgi:ribonuclease III
LSGGEPLDPGVIAALTGHRPTDAALFLEALTHGSHGDRADYQRLEFLGDRVLGLIIAEALYRRFPRESEGALAARLNGLVSRASCADVARSIGLGPHMRLGKQARDDGGRESDNILGDVVEALIGALFLDAGLDAARQFVMRHWQARIGAAKAAPKHPKSALMEWAAANRKKPPSYEVLDRSGPDHAPRFTVRAAVPHAGEAEGEGTSKAEAEAAAAAALLARLETRS